MKSILLSAALLMAGGAMTPALAQTTFAWPSEIGVSNTANPAAVRGAPDGVFTGLGSHHFVWVLKFARGAGSSTDLEKTEMSGRSAEFVRRKPVSSLNRLPVIEIVRAPTLCLRSRRLKNFSPACSTG